LKVSLSYVDQGGLKRVEVHHWPLPGRRLSLKNPSVGEARELSPAMKDALAGAMPSC
jgi:hypothetical protein